MGWEVFKGSCPTEVVLCFPFKRPPGRCQGGSCEVVRGPVQPKLSPPKLSADPVRPESGDSIPGRRSCGGGGDQGFQMVCHKRLKRGEMRRKGDHTRSKKLAKKANKSEIGRIEFVTSLETRLAEEKGRTCSSGPNM